MNEPLKTQFSAPTLSSETDVLIAVRLRQQDAWRAGDRVQIEELLDRHFPGVQLSDDQMLELILSEWLLARSLGEVTSTDTYERRFPALANRLSRLLSIASAIDLTSYSHTTSLSDLTSELTKTLDQASFAKSVPSNANVSLQPGLIIGKYRLEEQLGKGGMGVVYQASHTMIDHRVAIKVMLPHLLQQLSSQTRFLKEAQICVSLEHPNLVRTFNIDQEGPFLYMTMELLRGNNLAEEVSKKGPLESDRVAEMIVQAASGLVYAHSKGVVHRDIKPHNIMVVQDGSVKVLDLGLATLKNELHDWTPPENHVDESVLNQRLTSTGSVMGTVAYMAPEQARRPSDADARSDIYSLGCTAFYLLTGDTIHDNASPIDVLKMKLSQHDWPSLSLETLPTQWLKILPRMVAWNPEDRFQSMQDVLDELDRVFGDGEIWMPDARDLESLRSKLLQYGLVTENQWFEAQMSMVDHSRSFSTMQFRPDTTSSPTPVFELLFRMSTPNSDVAPCLSRFQVQQIIAGQIAKLRLPEHVILDSINNGWKGEVFRCRAMDGQSGDRLDRIEAVRILDQKKLLGLGSTPQEQVAAAALALEKLQQLDHPGVSKVLRMSWFDQRLLIASEYVPGVVLSSVVRERGFFKQDDDWAELFATAIEMAEGVEHLHSMGVLHLDLSTERWVRATNGSLRLLDAGLAGLLLPKKWGDIPLSSGMPPIVAPEMLGDLDAATPAADIYALGQVFRFLRSGEFPFKSMKLGDLPSPSPRRWRVTRSTPTAAAQGNEALHESLAAGRSRRSTPQIDWRVEFDQLTSCMTAVDVDQRMNSMGMVVNCLKQLRAAQESFAQSKSGGRARSLGSLFRGMIGR